MALKICFGALKNGQNEAESNCRDPCRDGLRVGFLRQTAFRRGQGVFWSSQQGYGRLYEAFKTCQKRSGLLENRDSVMDIFQKLLIPMIDLNSTQKSFIYASAQYMTAQRNQSTILPTSNIYLCYSKRRCLCLLNTFLLFILNSVTCKDAWTPSSLYVSNVLRYKHIRRKDRAN